LLAFRAIYQGYVTVTLCVSCPTCRRSRAWMLTARRLS